MGDKGRLSPVRCPVFPEIALDLATEVLSCPGGGDCMIGGQPATERRKWVRLPLAIPVFVRSRDDDGKEFLEFATALNVSAGGMLVAVRRILPTVAQIRLEIPSAPLAAVALLPKSSRDLRAKALRTTHAEGYYLLGLKFSRPLLPSTRSNGTGRRKVASAV
jgi:PilZ domain